MIESRDSNGSIIDRPIASSITLYDLLIPMIVVGSLSKRDTIVVGPTQQLDIMKPIMIDILIVPQIFIVVGPME